MSRAILVVRDLDAVRVSAEARAYLPRLPALEQWLARGELQALTGDWRQWLQVKFGGSDLAGTPPASIAGAAVPGVPADRPLWLATPVHFVPGLDTVRVHPQGLLPLSLPEQHALQQDFARVFAGSGCSLHATGRRELLLTLGPGYETGEVASDDPGMWLGADPRAGLPRGSGAGPLLRLGAELEMWLHRHPINEARAAAGLLGVNALWLWGGGDTLARTRDRHARSGLREHAVSFADELYVDGLARSLSWTVQPLPAGWPARAAGSELPPLRLVVAGLTGAANGPSLESIDRDWIAPALAEWRRGSHEITLLASRSAVTLARRSLRSAWRALRRARPWWQELPAC